MRSIRRGVGRTLAAALLWATTAAGAAQAQQSTAVISDAQLDKMLRARDWNTLALALSQPGLDFKSFEHRMTWMRKKLDAGGGFLLALFYSRDLWALGDKLQERDPSRDLRLPAGVQALYAYVLIQIDGAKCADRTAPAQRMQQLLDSRAPVFVFLRQQPGEVRARAVDYAIAYERRTAPLRAFDDMLCRDGLEQMQVGVESGTRQEVLPESGQFGRTIAVQPPAGWMPKMLPPQVYKPVQDKARATMPNTLARLIG